MRGTRALGEHVPFLLQTSCPGVAGGGPEWGTLECSAQGRAGSCLFFLVIINTELIAYKTLISISSTLSREILLVSSGLVR